MITVDELGAYGRNLVAADAPEVQLRNGAGRMYYAAFHRCRMVSEAHCNELPPDQIGNRGSHQKVYARLERHCRNVAISNHRLSLICQKAREMLELRVRADYHIDDSFGFGEAREMQALLFQLNQAFREIDREIERAAAD